MRLTDEQKDEIKKYIVTVPRFRETYNELYDHILNALENRNVAYSIEEVNYIINADFGGFSEIVAQEKIYQKELNKRYNKCFRQEFLNTFKWPGILNNLALLFLCFLIYTGSDHSTFNMKPMLIAIITCVTAVFVFGAFRVMSYKFRFSKYSILDNYFMYSSSFGIIMLNAFIHSFGKENSWGLSDNARLLMLLFVFFFSSVYIRVFVKFYKQRIKVLMVV